MDPLIIIGGVRSGTTFLQESLNSHPKISCASELLSTSKDTRKRHHSIYFKNNHYLKEQKEKSQRKRAIKYLENIVWPKNKIGRRCGFKMLTYQLDSWDIWDYIEEKNIDFIFIYRNHIARFISLIQATSTNVWSKRVYHPSVIADPVKIKIDDLYNFIELSKENEKRIKGFKSVFEISYESIVKNNKYTMNSIFEHFNLKDCKTFSKIVKQQSWDIESRIVNFEKFAENLKDKYKYLLDDLF